MLDKGKLLASTSALPPGKRTTADIYDSVEQGLQGTNQLAYKDLVDTYIEENIPGWKPTKLKPRKLKTKRDYRSQGGGF